MRQPLRVALKSWLAVGALFVVFAIPVAAGIAVFVDPIRRAGQPLEWSPVVALESLLPDAMPRRVPVLVARSDGWTRLPDEPVAHVFVRRTADSGDVHALRATYRLGCSVEYDAAAGRFDVPCRTGIHFDVNGHRLHSIHEWGDLRPVRSVVAGGTVYINLSDAMARER